MSRYLVVLTLTLAGCITQQRAAVATRAQTELVGMSKKDPLMCAGVPARQERIDDLEFLAYEGGGDSTSAAFRTSAYSAVSKTHQRNCEATFVLKDGVVQSVRYKGRTGGLFTKGEQCAFIVENCVR